MATGTPVWHVNGLKNFIEGDIDYLVDTIKVALYPNSATITTDMEFMSQVTGTECSGTGYTAGGATLTNKSIGVDTGNNAVTLKSDDPTWNNSTIANAQKAVWYVDKGSAAANMIICSLTADTASSSSAGTMALDVDATNGFLKIDG